MDISNNPRERIVINVGGKKFECFKNTLQKHPKTKLADLTNTSSFWDNERKEFFFDRDPKLFSFVLNFYRNGELHVPHNVCGPAIKRELEFWGITDNDVAPCCWKSYNNFLEQEKCIELVEDAFGGDVSYNVDHHTRKERIQKKIWFFLEDPDSSPAAKVSDRFIFTITFYY